MLLGLRSLWETTSPVPPVPVVTETPPSVSIGFPAIGGTPKPRRRRPPVMPEPARPMYWEPTQEELQEIEEFLILMSIDLD
jgi:hypothetical protein